ncbi:hypothetical protein [Pedobacter cryoconitis]|uniref:RNA polymerase sigma-70 factor (ECF subfamily) n=1 Tax=Pedobacter cryoconitis TaxID=188932 RepID=A0A7X0J231_9SPHI|nr:hypothetical protein [Pedobacter cryoconitis]MBB6499269.1 RNA polymerase sigma-70 factor (ECF subfamily) [Pedobacter cryoconitis]
MGKEKSVYSYFSDAMLLNDLRNSNRPAFEEIYERYWKKIYNDSYKRIKNIELVEELVKDVFVDLWENRKSLKIRSINQFLLIAMRARVFKLYDEGKAGPHFERGLSILKLVSLHKGIN